METHGLEIRSEDVVLAIIQCLFTKGFTRVPHPIHEAFTFDSVLTELLCEAGVAEPLVEHLLAKLDRTRLLEVLQGEDFTACDCSFRCLEIKGVPRDPIIPGMNSEIEKMVSLITRIKGLGRFKQTP